MERRLVVLGDVVKSREVRDRETLQRDLQNGLDEVNERYADTVYAPFVTLKGIDEVGGVLTDISVLYEIVKTVYRGTYPTAVRFAGVYGGIDVGAETENVAEMDGPAFHRADRMLSEMGDDNRLFSLYTGEDLLDVLIGNYVNLCLLQMNEWTAREMEIVRSYEGRGTQAAAAEALGVTQQRVSNVIRDTNWKVFHRMEADLNEALAAYNEWL